MDETAKIRTAEFVIAAKEASANCGNALIGESIGKCASDGGPCLRSRIAPIAAMSRPRDCIACMPIGETPKSDRESCVTVRIRSATKRETGALIRAGVVSRACGERNGHRCGDAVCSTDVRTVRKNCAGIACRPAGGTSKSDSESSVTVRTGSAAERESGALIRAGVGGISLRSERTAPWKPRQGGFQQAEKPLTTGNSGNSSEDRTTYNRWRLDRRSIASRSVGNDAIPTPGGSTVRRSQTSLECTPWVRQQNAGQRADGTTLPSRPTVAFKARMSCSRLSPSKRHQTASTVGRKHRRIRQLTQEIGDSIRHQSGVGKMSRISSPTTVKWASNWHCALRRKLTGIGWAICRVRPVEQ